MNVRAAFAIAVLWMSPALALADAPPNKKQCVAASDEGQSLRDQGKVSEARASFQRCSSKSCPKAVAKQCAEWSTEMEKATASMLFHAKSEGKEVVDVKVTVDGTVVAESIASEPLVVNPGVHEVKMERNGVVATESIELRPGEKLRIVDATLDPPAPAAPPPPPPTAPAPAPKPAPLPEKRGFAFPGAAYLGVGVGLAGGATATFFAIIARRDERVYRTTCAPHCSEHARNTLKTELLVANIGMFAGIAGLALAGLTTILANRRVRATADGFSYRF